MTLLARTFLEVFYDILTWLTIALIVALFITSLVLLIMMGIDSVRGNKKPKKEVKVDTDFKMKDRSRRIYKKKKSRFEKKPTNKDF